MSSTKLYLEEEAARYVSPILVYDRQQILTNVSALGRALGGIERVLFAVKSFPATEVLRAAREEGAGFEVSSLSEYDLLPEELSGSTVSLNAPARAPLEPYLERGNRLHVHLDSVQLDPGEKVTDRRPAGSSYALRLSHTEIGLPTECLGDERPSRFGASGADFAAAADLFRKGTLSGVHLHNGSEVNTGAFYLTALESILALAERHQIPLEFINLGGGLHPIEDLQIESLLKQLNTRAGDVEVLIEPGHVLCRRAGFLLTRVINVRAIDQSRFHVTLDTSYECHCKWSIPIWQPEEDLEVLRLAHNVVPQAEPGFQHLLFSGSSCYERDLMGVYRVRGTKEPPISLGQVLAFSGLNGYSYAWNTSFNGIPEARVRFV